MELQEHQTKIANYIIHIQSCSYQSRQLNANLALHSSTWQVLNRQHIEIDLTHQNITVPSEEKYINLGVEFWSTEEYLEFLNKNYKPITDHIKSLLCAEEVKQISKDFRITERLF